jgi:hypothetical protein
MNKWEKQTQNMPFCDFKTELAWSKGLQESLKTIRLYIQGRAKTYEMYEALRHIEYVYGQPIKDATTRIRKAMLIDDEELRLHLCSESLGVIKGHIERYKYW